MHAVVVKVTVTERESATKFLREEIVPRVSQAPGFVAGYWVRLEGGARGRGRRKLDHRFRIRGRGPRTADQIRDAAGSNPGVNINDISVGEVVANA